MSSSSVTHSVEAAQQCFGDVPGGGDPDADVTGQIQDSAMAPPVGE